MAYVFLSYSRYDATFANRLKTDLEREGHTIWMDTSEIVGGDAWVKVITEGVNKCDVMLSLVSTRAKESRWVMREFMFAEEKGKRIIPIKVEDVPLAVYMIELHSLNGFDPHYANMLRQLSATLPITSIAITPAPVDRRALELAYLDRVWLEHKVWVDTYTPMSGVAQMSVTEAVEIVTHPADIGALFSKFIDERLKPEVKVEQKNYTDILDAVRDLRQLVVLGDPGSGKTTTLWRIAADLADKAKIDPAAPIPVFIRLGELSDMHTLADRVDAVLGSLAPYRNDLIEQGRVAFLFDGLNELPASHRDANVKHIKAFIERAQKQNGIAVVTCRQLDYSGALDMDIPEKVVIQPLDPVRVQAFVNAYIKAPAGKGDELFWALAGKAGWKSAREWWDEFIQKVKLDERQRPAIFWLAENLPDGKTWGYGEGGGSSWGYWLNNRHDPRSLLTFSI